MTQEDKYAVVVDGDVVETAPTKKAAKEALESAPEGAETEVREFNPGEDQVKPLDGPIQHLR